jgi:hypothetical protein
MIKHRAIAVFTATALAAASALAEPTQRSPSSAPVAPESTEAGRDQPAAPSSSAGSFTRDVKHAWSEARDGARKTGHAIGDGARSFGRATRDAAVNGWRKVKEAFSG